MHELRPVCQTLITCPWQVESLRGSYAGRYNKDNTAITTYLCWLCHQTKKIILFVCLSWHSYLLRCGCSLSLPIPHGMHLVVPTHPCFFWALCHPNRTFSSKKLEQEPQTAKSCFLTSDPWPHHVLYWLGTCWRCLGLTHASLLCMSEICLLLMRLPWSRGSSTQSTVHLWLLMAWAIFWFLILWWLTPLRGRALFNCGFLLLQPILLFLPTILLPFLFRPTACSFLNDSVWPLGFLLHHLQAPVSHLFLLGHPWPIYFPWASLALFLTLYSHGFY